MRKPKPRNVTWIGKDVGARAWAYMKNGRKINKLRMMNIASIIMIVITNVIIGK